MAAGVDEERVGDVVPLPAVGVPALHVVGLNLAHRRLCLNLSGEPEMRFLPVKDDAVASREGCGGSR
jgi:hypothetical protein